ncbi:P-type DNA transfer ATPase VirB11 [Sphingobium sp. AN558]|uniref:P-type DNA transfer ATPase VirB11 n=1 Tax=Sphingobium sp. AN558 TaxID=3133442 RepID=UPI0030C14CCB
MNAASSSDHYFDIYLAPLVPYLSRADVTDIFINRPGEVWIETLAGHLTSHAVPELDEVMLWRLARQIASFSHQGISREHPLLAATLPCGARVQVVAPPATRGPMAMAIRKHVVPDLSLADYLDNGALEQIEFATRRSGALSPAPVSDAPAAIADFLSEAVRARRNIIVSGGTSTGKTTFLNALLKEIPAHERLVLIEDTPELTVTHSNSVGMLAVRGDLGEARITMDDLMQASLRMRPDRIILGELRGHEAYSFLRAVNTGHPGSFTTIHADTPEGALEQLALIVLQSGTQMRREDIIRYAESVVDYVVQLERKNGRRIVSRIMSTRAA